MVATRRPGVGWERRDGYRGIWTPQGERLDLFTGGTFTRAGEASIWDPDTGTLTWMPLNQRRTLGDYLIIEGARTNVLLNNRAPTGGSSLWTVGSGVTIETPDASPGPDSGESSDRMAINSGGYGRYKSFSAAASTRYLVSMLASRMPGAGSGPWQGSAERTDTEGAYASGTLAEGWSRKDWVYTPTTTATHYFLPWEGRTRTYGPTASALDYLYDLGQVEAGFWPSSPIRTTGSPATRAADLLSYAQGEYPASFLTSGFRFTITPGFTSEEFAAQALGTVAFLVYSNGGIGYHLSIYNAAGPVTRVRLMTNNVTIAQANVTFSREQPCTVEWRPSAGLLLSGFTTGNGLAAGVSSEWPASSTLRFGSNAGSSSFFGSFWQYVEGV